MPIKSGFFKKKPIPVLAVQLTDFAFDCEHPSDEHIPGVEYDPVNRVARIHTLEGVMTANIGDWIIRGVKGELWPCRQDIFEETYERIVCEFCTNTATREWRRTFLRTYICNECAVLGG